MTNEEYQQEQKFEGLTGDVAFNAAVELIAARMVDLTESHEFATIEVQDLVNKRIKSAATKALRERRQQPPPKGLSKMVIYGSESGRIRHSSPIMEERDREEKS